MENELATLGYIAPELKKAEDNYEETTGSRRATVPDADTKLIPMAVQVAASWRVKTDISVKWIKQAEFEQDVNTYKSMVVSSSDNKSTRKPNSSLLSDLNKEINSHEGKAKSMFQTQYKTTLAISMYEEIGIVKEGKAYRIPRNLGARQMALAKMVKGLEKYGFKGEAYPFGLEYWQEIERRFNELYNVSMESATVISSKTDDKKILKARIKKTLNSLISIIKGNYPDTYNSELRAWGFLRERN